jgi:hypothetical protein
MYVECEELYNSTHNEENLRLTTPDKENVNKTIAMALYFGPCTSDICALPLNVVSKYNARIQCGAEKLLRIQESLYIIIA